MTPLEQLHHNAAKLGKTVALSEGADPRIISAAIKAAGSGLAQLILVGDDAAMRSGFTAQGCNEIPDRISLHDPRSSKLTDTLATAYYERRKAKGMSEAAALEAAQDPHTYAALLVSEGHADGTVGGAVATTAEIIRTALRVIGPAKGTKLVSSFFYMIFPENSGNAPRPHLFSDCGLVVDPSAEELAAIAAASARSFEQLSGEAPRVAMLSFSTRGSAAHPAVSKVQEATQIARAENPDLPLDGELQFDAAFVPTVAASKAPNSPLAGRANVFIFPNLDAGNIGYKIAQRIGGASALGPVMQGLAKPANDLSRGCSAEDVLHMIAITALQAGTTP